MKVSIITVCLNSIRTIEQCIQSVIGQTHSNIEYIIVDGKSSDGTIDMIEKYSDNIAHYSSKRDKGIYDAMNRGLEKATGDYVIFLNADDYYSTSRSIETLVNHATVSKKDCYFGDIEFVSPKNASKVVRRFRSTHFKPVKFRFGFQPPHPTFFAKKCLYDRLGGYYPQFRIAGDFELMSRFLVVSGATYEHVPEILVTMRHGGISTAGLRSKIVMNKEIYQACKLNNIGTNYLMIYSKYLTKIFEYIIK